MQSFTVLSTAEQVAKTLRALTANWANFSWVATSFSTAKGDERTRKEDFLLRRRLRRDKWVAGSFFNHPPSLKLWQGRREALNYTEVLPGEACLSYLVFLTRRSLDEGGWSLKLGVCTLWVAETITEAT
jgi:hypothetical protein